MTEPNPEAKDIPLPDHVLEGESADEARARYAERVGDDGPDPVNATAPHAKPYDDDEEAELDDDELDESARQKNAGVPFPIAGPMQGTAVPPGYINPQ